MKILTTPHPFLKHVAKPVTSWDKKTANEVKEMAEILKKTTNPKGVGLAATQVGLDKRIFILLSEEKVQVFVNPQIVLASKKMLASVYKKKADRWLEGCLSIPRIWGFVDRPYEITVEYDSPVSSPKTGEETPLPRGGEVLKKTVKTFSDVEAAYIQHEVDHLDGVLFTDRIREQNGTILRETEDGLAPISL